MTYLSIQLQFLKAETIVLNSHSKLGMNPEALILFYEPNHLYKNRKYLVGLGDNFVGSCPHNEILIEDTSLPPKAASFRLRSNLISLLRVDDHCTILVQSNLIPKTKVNLEKDTEYILMPDRQFQVGKWRGLFKVIDREEAKLIKGIVNREVFNFDVDTKKSEINEDVGDALLGEIPNCQVNNNMPHLQVHSETTLVQPDPDMLATLIIPDIDDDQDTEKLEQSDRQQQPLPVVMSQLAQVGKSGQQQGQIVAVQSFNMPQTLNDDDELAINPQDEQMPKTLEDQAEQLGNTILEQNQQFQTQPSAVYTRSSLIPGINLGRQSQRTGHQQKQYQSLPEDMKRRLSDTREPSGFQDILDEFVVRGRDNPKKQQSINRPQNENSRIVRRILKQPSSVSLGEATQELKGSKAVSEQRKVAIAGFKPNQFQRFILSKKGMRMVQNPDEDYQVLITSNQPKITKKLLVSVILGKEIISQSYLSGGSKDVFYKLYGLLWTDIVKPMSRASIFGGCKVFLSQSLHNYLEVVQLCGGGVIDQLSRTRGKVILMLSKQDQDIYEKYKSKKDKLMFSEAELQKAIFLNRFPEETLTDDYFK